MYLQFFLFSFTHEKVFFFCLLFFFTRFSRWKQRWEFFVLTRVVVQTASSCHQGATTCQSSLSKVSDQHLMDLKTSDLCYNTVIITLRWTHLPARHKRRSRSPAPPPPCWTCKSETKLLIGRRTSAAPEHSELTAASSGFTLVSFRTACWSS